MSKLKFEIGARVQFQTGLLGTIISGAETPGYNWYRVQLDGCGRIESYYEGDLKLLELGSEAAPGPRRQLSGSPMSAEIDSNDRVVSVRVGGTVYLAATGHKQPSWARGMADLAGEIVRLKDENQRLSHSNESFKATVRWDAVMAAEITKLERHLGNLLAIVHSDGGHYAAEHGIEKAVADAPDAIYARNSGLAADERDEAMKRLVVAERKARRTARRWAKVRDVLGCGALPEDTVIGAIERLKNRLEKGAFTAAMLTAAARRVDSAEHRLTDGDLAKLYRDSSLRVASPDVAISPWEDIDEKYRQCWIAGIAPVREAVTARTRAATSAEHARLTGEVERLGNERNAEAKARHEAEDVARSAESANRVLRADVERLTRELAAARVPVPGGVLPALPTGDAIEAMRTHDLIGLANDDGKPPVQRWLAAVERWNRVDDYGTDEAIALLLDAGNAMHATLAAARGTGASTANVIVGSLGGIPIVHRLPVADATPPSTPTATRGASDESAWLIEHADSDPSAPRYWTGSGWSYDVNRAQRFVAKPEAIMAAPAGGHRVEEHAWCAPRPTAGPGTSEAPLTADERAWAESVAAKLNDPARVEQPGRTVTWDESGRRVETPVSPAPAKVEVADVLTRAIWNVTETGDGVKLSGATPSMLASWIASALAARGLTIGAPLGRDELARAMRLAGNLDTQPPGYDMPAMVLHHLAAPAILPPPASGEVGPGFPTDVEIIEEERNHRDSASLTRLRAMVRYGWDAARASSPAPSGREVTEAMCWDAVRQVNGSNLCDGEGRKVFEALTAAGPVTLPPVDDAERLVAACHDEGNKPAAGIGCNAWADVPPRDKSARVAVMRHALATLRADASPGETVTAAAPPAWADLAKLVDHMEDAPCGECNRHVPMLRKWIAENRDPNVANPSPPAVEPPAFKPDEPKESGRFLVGDGGATSTFDDEPAVEPPSGERFVVVPREEVNGRPAMLGGQVYSVTSLAADLNMPGAAHRFRALHPSIVAGSNAVEFVVDTRPDATPSGERSAKDGAE
jgi:hypothetical protein